MSVTSRLTQARRSAANTQSHPPSFSSLLRQSFLLLGTRALDVQDASKTKIECLREFGADFSSAITVYVLISRLVLDVRVILVSSARQIGHRI